MGVVMWKHKKKVLCLCAAVAGACVGGHYLVKKIWLTQESERNQQLESIRLKEHYEGTEPTTQSAVVGLLTKLRETVLEKFDTAAITEQLKTKPANKIVLWENLKITSFAHLLSSAYACTLMAVFIRVQLSVVGGSMFQDLHMPSSSTPIEVQKKYLSIVENFFDEGLVALMEVIKAATEIVLSSYSLKHQLSCSGMMQILSDIRHQVLTLAYAPHSPLSRRRQRSFLVQYIVPKETLLGEPGDSQINTLVSATTDILESGEFSEVLESCFQVVFTKLSQSLTESYHSAAQSQPTLPLARVIPLISDHSQMILASPTFNNFTQGVLGTMELQRLSENVYEAFALTSDHT